MLKFSGKARCGVWIFCSLAMLCLHVTIAAQSRQQKKANTVSTEQTVPVETKSPETDDKKDDKKKERILALKVVGELQHNLGYYKSNDLDNALKEFVRSVKDYSKTTMEITKGGKMTYTEAKEQAKKEAGMYYLWLGYSAKADSYGNAYLDFVQYAIIKPETAEIVTRGQIEPYRNRLPTPGGGTVKLPTASRSWNLLLDMKTGARNVAEILMRDGWID